MGRDNFLKKKRHQKRADAKHRLFFVNRSSEAWATIPNDDNFGEGAIFVHYL